MLLFDVILFFIWLITQGTSLFTIFLLYFLLLFYLIVVKQNHIKLTLFNNILFIFTHNHF